MAIIGDERYVTENVTCMIHEVFSHNVGTYTHMISGMKRLQTIHDKISKIYLNNNNKINNSDLNNLLNKETWFTAAEYVEYGFADGIYMSNEDNNEKQPYKRCKTNGHIRFNE